MAYAACDEDGLRALKEEWEAGPAPKEREPSASDELYARLEWLSERKELLSSVAVKLEEGAIGQMLKLAPDDPDKLLEEIAEELLTRVAEKESRLRDLVG
jgi:hypothetical protein